VRICGGACATHCLTANWWGGGKRQAERDNALERHYSAKNGRFYYVNLTLPLIIFIAGKDKHLFSKSKSFLNISDNFFWQGIVAKSFFEVL
jgi:hypothetical protein